MLIICKSCKKLIDTNKHDFCPKCGSNFNYGENLTAATNTADYEEYERRMAEQQRAAVENRMNNTKQATKKETQKRLKKQANDVQGKKNGCIGCFAVVIFLFAAFGAILGDSDIDIDEFLEENFGNTAETTAAYELPENIYIDIPDYIENLADEDDVTYTQYILAGETAQAKNYSFICKEVSEYENEFFPPKEGYKYISFTFALTNTTNSERFYYDSVKCFVDEEEYTSSAVSGLFLPGALDAGQTYEGSVAFEVPEEALFFDIYYGDEVVIYTSVSDIEGYFEDYEG